MPTYDYECERCGHTFERFQSITERPVRTCPECGKRSVKRLIGAGAGLIFKGSGFYATDYRSEGYKKALKQEGTGGGGGKETPAGGEKASGGKDGSKSEK